MSEKKETKDIQNPTEELEKLQVRFKRLHDRFLAIAMDYKHYIDSNIKDDEIYKLRDNVFYRLDSARFHFQLLLDHHSRVEIWLKDLYKSDPKQFFTNGFDLNSIRYHSTRQVYSLFDSTIYHLCSIFDYLFRLINFTNGKTIAGSPKWNLFKSSKNLRTFEFCSKELIPKLQFLDEKFVYPLIKHRSHLIHTALDTGDFKLVFNLGGDNFDAKFQSTTLFKEHFPEIIEENGNIDFTIKYAALWLIDKSIKTTTEVLFELSEDMKRNKKIPHGLFVLLGPDNTIQPASTPLWGDRNVT